MEYAKEESPSLTHGGLLGSASQQNHSRLSCGVRTGAWFDRLQAAVANSKLSPQACRTHSLSPLSLPSSGVSDVIKASSPWWGLEGEMGRSCPKICHFVEHPASTCAAPERSQIKDVSSPDGVLLLEFIKAITEHSKHPIEILQQHTNMTDLFL